MRKQNEMVEALESFVIKKAKSFDEQTSPEEIVALAELVKAVNQAPGTLEAFGSQESTYSARKVAEYVAKELSEQVKESRFIKPVNNHLD